MYFRRGHEILHSVLPPKFEHVILVRNSPVQEVLYDLNMLQTQEQQKSGTIANIGPLKAFAVCSKVIVKHAVHVHVHLSPHLSLPISLSPSLSPPLSLPHSLPPLSPPTLSPPSLSLAISLSPYLSPPSLSPRSILLSLSLSPSLFLSLPFLYPLSLSIQQCLLILYYTDMESS